MDIIGIVVLVMLVIVVIVVLQKLLGSLNPLDWAKDVGKVVGDIAGDVAEGGELILNPKVVEGEICCSSLSRDQIIESQAKGRGCDVGTTKGCKKTNEKKDRICLPDSLFKQMVKGTNVVNPELKFDPPILSCRDGLVYGGKFPAETQNQRRYSSDFIAAGI